MSKSVKITIAKDKSGEFVASYEVSGYAGLACEEVAQAMASLGNVTDRKISDSAYQQEIPLSVPLSQM